MRKLSTIVLTALVLGFAASFSESAQMVGSTNTGSRGTRTGSGSYIDHGWETSMAVIVTPFTAGKHWELGGDIQIGYELPNGLYFGGQVTMEWLYLYYMSHEFNDHGNYESFWASDFSVPVYGVVRKYFNKAYRFQPYLNGGLGFLADRTVYYEPYPRFAINLQAGGGIRARVLPHFSAFLEADMNVMTLGGVRIETKSFDGLISPRYRFAPVIKLGITYHLDNPPFWQRQL